MVIVVIPVMDVASSIVVVPPAESIVRFPVEVSISLSPAIPIRILSIVAPPFASRRPVNVVFPPTLRFSEIPAPPVTIKVPVVDEVEVVPVVKFNLPA